MQTTIIVKDKDGHDRIGTPFGLILIDGKAFMTLKLEDDSILRIEPQKNWNFDSDTGWHYDG